MDFRAGEYLSIEQVAEEWGVSRDYIVKMRNRRTDPLPFKRLPGKERGYLITREDLRSWFDRNAS